LIDCDTILASKEETSWSVCRSILAWNAFQARIDQQIEHRFLHACLLYVVNCIVRHEYEYGRNAALDVC
jgi:hypothetical protein